METSKDNNTSTETFSIVGVKQGNPASHALIDTLKMAILEQRNDPNNNPNKMIIRRMLI